MTDRFELLTSGVTKIYRCVEKIKKSRMNPLGLKGAHVMCLYYLSQAGAGLTLAQLCEKCNGDKAGISRILSDLEKRELIRYNGVGEGKKYRAKASLTARGQETVQNVLQLIREATVQGGQGISDEEREIFYKVLFLIGNNLQRVCDALE